jgi:prolyl-tRNA synthetase
MRAGDEACDAASNDVYAKLDAAGLEPLLDDTNERAGAKFATMDLIGVPYQVVIGPRGLKEGKVEVKIRASGERHELSLEDAVNRLVEGAFK